MKHTGFLDKQSLNISARNPLFKDETILDYDMDSEEEWNELNGEDLDMKKEDEQDEEEEDEKMEGEQDEEEGFIVPDDYLSVSELNLS
jgi:chromatin assembly factor 1 subunit A